LGTTLLDESWTGKVITVGGFLAADDDLLALAQGWREMKIQMSLTAQDELKYAIDDDHPSRPRLDAAGWLRAERLPVLLEWVATQPVLLIADTVHDWRDGDTAQVQHLYVHALGWCIRRAANHVQFDLGGPDGPHTVLVDMPNPAHGIVPEDQTGLLRTLKDSLGTAAFALYQDRYLNPESFPSGATGSPLVELGFRPELHASHARHSDLLQIADLVAGSVRELSAWYLNSGVDEGGAFQGGWREENFLRIADAFRSNAQGEVLRIGLDVFSPEHPATGLSDYLERLLLAAARA
jgi:hypothetical protein